MKIYIVLTTLLLSASPAHALTCAPPNGTPRDQIADAYDKSDLVALAVQNSVFRYGELAIKAVWKGNPEPIINVQFTLRILPARTDLRIVVRKHNHGTECLKFPYWQRINKIMNLIGGI